MLPLIYDLNQAGPGSLSSNLFWYKDKVFTQLPYEVEGRAFHFIPPSNFEKLLNDLASNQKE